MTTKKSLKEVILESKKTIIEYINQDDMILLKNTDKDKYLITIYNKFSIFRDKYPFLLDKIISGENDELLNMMLDNILILENSSNVEDDLLNIRNKMADTLHNQYVKDKISGKNLTKY